MPIKKCKKGLYAIGSGPCMYKSKKKATKAYRGYLWKKKNKRDEIEEVENIQEDINGGQEDVS